LKQRLVIITEIIAPYRIPLFNALAEQSTIDLHVIFLAETDATQRQWLVYKDEIHFAYEVLPAFRQRILGYNFLLNLGMSKALKGACPQAILCGGYSYFATWMALGWARHKHVPFYLWSESNSHDLRSGGWVTESLKRIFFRRCNGFVVPGHSSRDYLLGYGVSDVTIFTAPNAVDNDLFAAGANAARATAEEKRRSLNLPSRYFLFVGRLTREKGVFDLFEAYRSLDPEVRPEVGLVFVGNGAARAELERLAIQVSPGTVRVVSFAQRDQLTIYYGLAEVFVFPTHSDPWGLVVNEAMACGLPILATNVAGCVADLVEEGKNGFVSAVRDIPALTKGMTTLAGSPRLREQMAAASLERIALFSASAWAQGIAKAVSSGGPVKYGF
jgi:glycosyltransferase involved in cell wall biosynthesis